MKTKLQNASENSVLFTWVAATVISMLPGAVISTFWLELSYSGPPESITRPLSHGIAYVFLIPFSWLLQLILTPMGWLSCWLYFKFGAEREYRFLAMACSVTLIGGFLWPIVYEGAVIGSWLKSGLIR